LTIGLLWTKNKRPAQYMNSTVYSRVKVQGTAHAIQKRVQCRQTSSRKFAKSAPMQYFTRRTKNFFAYVAA
jgi:hypothetical protein